MHHKGQLSTRPPFQEDAHIRSELNCFCLQARCAGGHTQRVLQWTHQRRQGARRAGAAPSEPAAPSAWSGSPSLPAGHHDHQLCGWLATTQVCMPKAAKGTMHVPAAHQCCSQVETHGDNASHNGVHKLLCYVRSSRSRQAMDVVKLSRGSLLASALPAFRRCTGHKRAC